MSTPQDVRADPGGLREDGRHHPDRRGLQVSLMNRCVVYKHGVSDLHTCMMRRAWMCRLPMQFEDEDFDVMCEVISECMDAVMG